MSSVFRTAKLVEFGDTDMAGIVHFANFFRYMESAEHAFLRSRGLSVVTRWQGEVVSFPRVSASCDYLKPARFEEVLEVTVRVERLGRTSITYQFEFLRGEELLARGSITAVLCRKGEGGGLETVEIPQEMREKLLGEVGG